MKLNFNLEDISYLKLDFENSNWGTLKLALKEKRENEFVAVSPKQEGLVIETPQKISLSFVCSDGLYKTSSILNEVYEKDDFIYFIIKNPETLDYQQNREYYRILLDYDCIYTMETDDGIESFNAVTYDISAGGVSIITSEKRIPTHETSIVIFMPERDLKSHLKFVRCETYNDDYKLSFIFTDLSEKDYEMLSALCVNKQISSF